MFLVTHFSDVRIANSDIRDILLQSISVLVQYKEHVVSFERSQAAREGMVGNLLTSFDNRFWIHVYAKAQASECQNIRHMENRSPLTFRFVGI